MSSGLLGVRSPLPGEHGKRPVRAGIERLTALLLTSWRLVVILSLAGAFAVRFAFVWACRRSSARSTRQLLGETLCRGCEALGPTFIKLGQVMSARPDLIPREFVQAFARLHTRASPLDPRVVRRVLERAYGAPVDAVFAEFQDAAIGSGSIAQVHRVRFKDGAAMALKVRRPGVERRIDADLRLLTAAARMAARLPALRFMPVLQLASDVGELIRRQVDFQKEGESLRRLGARFDRIGQIRIPAVAEAWCRPSVLAMEFIPDLQAVTAPHLPADLRRAVALRGLRALYRMIFIDGFIHADMHPGNVFVRPSGELVILDAGLVTTLSDRTRRHFVDFFFAMANGQGSRCADIICQSALFIRPGCDLAAFRAAIVELIDVYAGLRSREFELMRFVAELMETQRRFGVCGSTEFVTTIIALIVFEGICKQMYPECDFQAEARPFLIAARYERAPAKALAGFMSG